MKLQLASDALRLRLTAAEFAQLRAGGTVAADLPLPNQVPLRVRFEAGEAFAVLEAPGVCLALPRADLAALEARLPCRDGLEYAAEAPTGPIRIVIDVDIRDVRRTTR